MAFTGEICAIPPLHQGPAKVGRPSGSDDFSLLWKSAIHG